MSMVVACIKKKKSKTVYQLTVTSNITSEKKNALLKIYIYVEVTL